MVDGWWWTLVSRRQDRKQISTDWNQHWAGIFHLICKCLDGKCLGFLIIYIFVKNDRNVRCEQNKHSYILVYFCVFLIRWIDIMHFCQPIFQCCAWLLWLLWLSIVDYCGWILLTIVVDYCWLMTQFRKHFIVNHETFQWL